MNDEYEDIPPPPLAPAQEETDAFVDAAEKGDAAAVTAFLDGYAAFIDGRSFGGTALTKASAHGQKEIVKLLLEKGAQVDARDQNKWTPLMNAADKGHAEIAAFLLEHGAQIDAVGQEGDSALMRAALFGNTKTVELLLKKGADTSIENNRDQTALMHAEIWGDALPIADLIEKWPEMQRQRKEEEKLRKEELAEVKAKEHASGQLEKLRNLRPPKPPFKKNRL